MSTILQGLLSCCEPAPPRHSRSRSRGSDDNPPRRSRSDRYPGHDDTRHRPASRYRGQSSRELRPEDRSHGATPSRQYTANTHEGTQTKLVYRSHRTRLEQSERGHPRRSTLPSNLEATGVPSRRHTEYRSGFEPLDHKDAYEGVNFLQETEYRRGINREERSGTQKVKPTHTQTKTSGKGPDRKTGTRTDQFHTNKGIAPKQPRLPSPARNQDPTHRQYTDTAASYAYQSGLAGESWAETQQSLFPDSKTEKSTRETYRYPDEEV